MREVFEKKTRKTNRSNESPIVFEAKSSLAFHSFYFSGNVTGKSPQLTRCLIRKALTEVEAFEVKNK